MNISKEKDNGKKDEQKEDSIKNPKFYIAILVCLSAVSAAGWSTYKTVKNFITPPQENSSKTSSRVSRPKGNTTAKEVNSKNNILEPEKSEITNSEKNSIPFEKNPKIVSNLEESIEKIKDESNEEVQAVWAEKPETITISYPTTSTITKEFSDNAPVYSKTLGDWRCHEGIDFKAEKGSPVKSITSGVVTDIYEDPSYGTTIVVSHDTQFTAYYSGLSQDTLVKKGNRIKSGEEIGTIDTVPCEALDESHLHLSINKEGNFIDPILVLEKET